MELGEDDCAALVEGPVCAVGAHGGGPGVRAGAGLHPGGDAPLRQVGLLPHLGRAALHVLGAVDAARDLGEGVAGAGKDGIK